MIVLEIPCSFNFNYIFHKQLLQIIANTTQMFKVNGISSDAELECIALK